MSLDPPPVSAPLSQQSNSLMAQDWTRWVLALWQQFTTVPATILTSPLTLTNQNASIAVTPIPLPALAGGFYRISWSARITTVDPVSSSLTITFGWVESSVVLTQSGAAMTGNTTTTQQSGSIVVFADQATALTYATTYVSNTPGTMRYRLSIPTVEQL